MCVFYQPGQTQSSKHGCGRCMGQLWVCWRNGTGFLSNTSRGKNVLAFSVVKIIPSGTEQMPKFSCLPSSFHVDLHKAILEDEKETILLLWIRCCISSLAEDPPSNFLETHRRLNFMLNEKFQLYYILLAALPMFCQLMPGPEKPPRSLYSGISPAKTLITDPPF